MCLHTLQKEPTVAENDIVVYKVMHLTRDGVLTSSVQNYRYTLGVEETAEMMEQPGGKFANDYEWDWAAQYSWSKLLVIGPGLHAYKTLEDAEKNRHGHAAIVECVIPKGSLYYDNPVNLIVSNRLMPVKIHNSYLRPVSTATF